MDINLEQMVETLQRIRREHGVEDFQRALRGLFRDLLWKDGGEAYIEHLMQALGRPSEVDFERLKAEARTAWDKTSAASSAGATNPVGVVEAAIKQAVPNCKTQAHFDLILHAWQALQLYINAAYGLDVETAAKAREGLNRLLDLAPQLAATHEKLADNPEATKNRDFVNAPKQMTEVETLRLLMLELGEISTPSALQEWYQRSRARMDGIITQKLRDELFDAIRAKKHSMAN